MRHPLQQIVDKRSIRMSSATIRKKGQITIPRDLRRHFGLHTGTAVCFEIEGDHIALRPAPAARDVAASGFGLIRSHRPADSSNSQGNPILRVLPKGFCRFQPKFRRP
jgi:AbrB family looped-hinge helix DNA binding protein